VARVNVEADRAGRQRQVPPRTLRRRARRNRARLTAGIIAAGALAVIAAAVAVLGSGIAQQDSPTRPAPGALPTAPGSYLGVYADGVPASYAKVAAFTNATGIRPRLVSYYSGWREPFSTAFAATVARHGAVPLVQIDPTHVNLAAVASGRYDSYLTAYAKAVRAYQHPVVLSFGHEMNANWYSWGYGSASPANFVAAWRHIVTLFRERGARNVTWLWTVNVIDAQVGIPAPGPWWPGKSYVTWVGIDGYYTEPSITFAVLFGPTVTAVRELTGDPILIAETSVVPAAGQPEKIPDLFAGVRKYGLLGLVWFDDVTSYNYRITSPAAIAAFRRAAKAYIRPTP
jgi:mannan endo-1,4-beta-mannosidase